MSYDLVNIFKDIDILHLKLYKHIIAIGCLSLNRINYFLLTNTILKE